MRLKTFTLFFSLLLLSVFTKAATSLYVSNPQRSWQQTKGFITAPEIEVTPRGLYAEVAMTFKINAQSSYFTPTDSLESVLNFDLPANSFIHDSYLWLNDSVVVKADIIEKGRAVTAYETIVKRRRDPSLLTKTGANSYQLNVFPMTTSFPRKVKIVFSVPFTWLNDKVTCSLPVDILNSSAVIPDFVLKANADYYFNQPSLLEPGVLPMALTNGTYLFNLPVRQYQPLADLNLSYKTAMNNGVFLGVQPTSANEGVYQLAVHPSFVAGRQPKHVVIILDHPEKVNYNSIYTLKDIKQYVQSFLLSQFSSTDSFNIFYVDKTYVRSLDGWQATDYANVSLAFNAMPEITSDPGKFEDLLKTATGFAKTKPGANTQVVMLSNGKPALNQFNADTIFNHLKAYLGGSFPNTINIINYSTQTVYVTNTPTVGNEALYSKISIASGGNHYRYTNYKYVYDQSPGGYSYYFDLDVKNILRGLAKSIGYQTSTYSLNLPVSGFVYGEYPINNSVHFSISNTYTETGKYYGSIQSGGNIHIQAMTTNGLVDTQIAVGNLYAGSNNMVQAWVNKYIGYLQGYGTSYVSEMIDSSIHNRVLCDYTAFLALETSDTVKASLDNVLNGGSNPGPTSIENTKKEETVKCYPNPFVNELTIECTMAMDELEIYDVTGKKVFDQKLSNGVKRFTWNGNNMSGSAVPQGLYLIRIKAGSATTTLKVQKL